MLVLKSCGSTIYQPQAAKEYDGLLYGVTYFRIKANYGENSGFQDRYSMLRPR